MITIIGQWLCSCGGDFGVIEPAYPAFDVRCRRCERVYRVTMTAVEVVGSERRDDLAA